MFNEVKISNTEYIREFKNDIDDEDLKWHFDDEDRIIEVIGYTDWKFQFDNELPQNMNDQKIFIKKGNWHRIIKGSNDLKVKLIKII